MSPSLASTVVPTCLARPRDLACLGLARTVSQQDKITGTGSSSRRLRCLQWAEGAFLKPWERLGFHVKEDKREMLRVDGRLTNCETGDRFAYMAVPQNPNEHIPRFVELGGRWRAREFPGPHTPVKFAVFWSRPWISGLRVYRPGYFLTLPDSCSPCVCTEIYAPHTWRVLGSGQQ
ncbi:hypothetical protein Bbelb_302840 [Branchiostoma belcheri]|nr:hypothetical protein Bbelb_302840 [Branchiostoma belcheri]